MPSDVAFPLTCTVAGLRLTSMKGRKTSGHKYPELAHLPPAEYRRQTRNLAREARRKNGEKVVSDNRHWRASQLRRFYGLTVEQYDKMNDEQKGLCAICGNPDEKRKLAVDHCHETGKVRGLLCRGCNIGLGGLRDDVGRLEAAIEYLRTRS